MAINNLAFKSVGNEYWTNTQDCDFFLYSRLFFPKGLHISFRQNFHFCYFCQGMMVESMRGRITERKGSLTNTLGYEPGSAAQKSPMLDHSPH